MNHHELITANGVQTQGVGFSEKVTLGLEPEDGGPSWERAMARRVQYSRQKEACVTWKRGEVGRVKEGHILMELPGA